MSKLHIWREYEEAGEHLTLIGSKLLRLEKASKLEQDVLLQGTQIIIEIVKSIKQPGATLPDTIPVLTSIRQLLDSPALVETVDPGSDDPTQPVAHPKVNSFSRSSLPGLTNHPDLLSALSDLDLQKITAVQQAHQQLMVVKFSPSPIRAGRGENFNMLREQLQQRRKWLKHQTNCSRGSQ